MSLPDTEQTLAQNSSSGLVPSIAKRRSRYNLPLIVRREYTTRIQQRSFQIVTIVLMLIVIVGASFPTILAAITSKVETQITVVNTAGQIGKMDNQALLAFLNTNLNVGYNNSQDPTNSRTTQKAHFSLSLASENKLTTLRQQVRTNQLSILLQITRNTSKDLIFTYYTNDSLTQNADLSQVHIAATQLRIQDQLGILGISNAQASSLFSAPDFTATSSLQEQSGRTPAESNAVVVEVLFAIVLLFIFIQQYCSMVATGVAEEKGSRIMEILINATTPFQLLLGKVIGIGLVGISQMSLVCLVAAATLEAQSPLKTALGVMDGNSFSLPDFTSISLAMLGFLVLFFVLGFLLYATIYAAAGALVSRQEEVATAVGPLGFLLMASYLLSFYATVTPNAAWIVPLSYVPFFTPMLMLARYAITPLPWWEIALSGALMLVSILILTWVAAYIYRIGVLMYGQKPGFGPFIRYLRSGQKGAA